MSQQSAADKLERWGEATFVAIVFGIPLVLATVIFVPVWAITRIMGARR